uniref:Lipase n=1 Tax=Romanomermis culicivorax TaxID=13658 RepID=A0A915JFX1_ROMCU
MNVSTVIFWSSEDRVAGGGDVKKLFQKLKNFRSYKVEHFRHIDFSFSYKAANSVYKKILQVLNE